MSCGDLTICECHALTIRHTLVSLIITESRTNSAIFGLQRSCVNLPEAVPDGLVPHGAPHVLLRVLGIGVVAALLGLTSESAILFRIELQVPGTWHGSGVQ